MGLGHRKPKHFRDMLKVIWKNRDNLGYGWDVLTKGVCDGCALGVAGLHDWTINGTHLCMTRLNLMRLNTMPAFAPDVLADVNTLRGKNNQDLREMGRLAYPYLRRKGDKGFTRITWDDALLRIASRIQRSTPDRLAFFQTSRGITNEVYYTAQKLARFLGTNNIDNAARLCHSPSTAAIKSAIGAAATTCSYKDFMGSDLVVFFGANPANDQPVTTKYLHKAKKLGTKIALVNPYLEPAMTRYWVPSEWDSAVFGTKLADYWFPVSKGGDIAFLYGVLRILFENMWYDPQFVEQHTSGFEALRDAACACTWDELEAQSGLKRQSIEEFATLIRDAKTAVLVWSMGITQHTFGGDGVQMVMNLGLTKGFVGREKCGLMPIRGHSGVQGGAEMGAYATAFPGGKTVNEENARTLSEQYGFTVPAAPGIIATNMVEAGQRGELDLLYCSGGNFLRTLPDPEYVAKAMARLPLRVHADIILTDQMLIEPTRDDGEVILLPAKTRYEQDDGGTQTSTERRIMFSPEIPRQVGEARAEWKIYLDIAKAVDPERAKTLGCETGQAIREEIARIVPMYDGIQHLKKTGDAVQYGGPHLCAGWKFDTPDGKAHFKPVPLPDNTLPKGKFHCATRRGKQFNTLIYAEVDPINGAPRDAVLMNTDDAARLHLKAGDRVALVNELGRYEVRVHLAAIAPRNLQVHWPEGNVIIPRGLVDKAGGVPDYNAVVSVERL
ncbi:MAG: FdhF/YdeP family oxidoreductase [Phycisphaera sp.]|nr:FdhF/YdeP family oxidoreductase [Phycisphaera sp.]